LFYFAFCFFVFCCSLRVVSLQVPYAQELLSHMLQWNRFKRFDIRQVRNFIINKCMSKKMRAALNLWCCWKTIIHWLEICKSHPIRSDRSADRIVFALFDFQLGSSTSFWCIALNDIYMIS
jgi:hypothetical protein